MKRRFTFVPFFFFFCSALYVSPLLCCCILQIFPKSVWKFTLTASIAPFDVHEFYRQAELSPLWSVRALAGIVSYGRGRHFMPLLRFPNSPHGSSLRRDGRCRAYKANETNFLQPSTPKRREPSPSRRFEGEKSDAGHFFNLDLRFGKHCHIV